MALTWPTALHPVKAVPGALRSDLWDGLWSLWFPLERLRAGASLVDVAGLLNHPRGGALWIADPVNALLGLPLVAAFGPAAAWSVVSMLHVAFAGAAGHLFGAAVARTILRAEAPSRDAADLDAAAWRAGLVAGVAHASAPILMAHLHNGATEAVGTGWLALAGWACWRLAEAGGKRWILAAGALLGLCAVAHAYAGACGYLLAGVLLLAGPFAARVRAPHDAATGGGEGSAPAAAPAAHGAAGTPGGTMLSFLRTRASLAAALVLGLGLAAGPLLAAQHYSTVEGNVVGIKDTRELATVRRSIGPADPVAFVMPGDYRSPDFRDLSRYGEQYVHTPYLGLLALGAAAWGLRRRTTWPLAAAGVLGAALACGPVLARFGAPVIFARHLAVPLPWFLVEDLPGFSGLSLLWRLGQLSALVVAVLAGVSLADARLRGRPVALAALPLLLLETRLVSPARDLPFHADATPPAALETLAEAPPGGVMTFPVSGGQRVLWEQTVHGKPLAASLNFPNNRASMQVWKTMLAQEHAAPDLFVRAVGAAARKEKVRYLVVHHDPWARPDMHDAAVRAVKGAFPVYAGTHDVKVYQLW